MSEACSLSIKAVDAGLREIQLGRSRLMEADDVDKQRGHAHDSRRFQPSLRRQPAVRVLKTRESRVTVLRSRSEV
jgi:hypothetical protein